MLQPNNDNILKTRSSYSYTEMSKKNHGFTNQLLRKKDDLTFSEVRGHLNQLESFKSNISVKSTPKRNSLYSNITTRNFAETNLSKRNSVDYANNFLYPLFVKTQT